MKAQQGFSLIELAIVLVIVTLLVGGLAMPLSAQIQARRIAETNKIIGEAREALFGYAVTNRTPGGRPYLPCPDTDGNGRENRGPAPNLECLQPRGYFPWVDMGTASQDAWGNRLWYEVSDAYSNGNTGFSNTTGAGDIQVCNVSGCNPGNVASNIPAILVSSGPNGWSALNVNGNTLPAPTSNDEIENSSAFTNVNRIYVNRVPSPAGPNEFDDLVVWISRALLVSRVCPSGGCP